MSVYDMVIDFTLGLVLLGCIYSVPRIKKMANTARGKRFRFKYRSVLILAFTGWLALLIAVMILSGLLQGSKEIASMTHTSSILNLIVQVLNTLQFWAAMEFMNVVELIMRIGTNRIKSHVSCKEERPDSTGDSGKPSILSKSIYSRRAFPVEDE